MFKWSVIFGALLVLGINNYFLKREVVALEASQTRAGEQRWAEITREHQMILGDLLEHFHARPNQWPVEGSISSRFGWREDPFTGTISMHYGVDIRSPYGTPVFAPAPGRVVFVGDGGGLGNLVAIEHQGRIVTRYGHLSDWFVKLGSWVKRGEKIAEIGTTGRSTGAHLHYSVEKNGFYEDPMEYLE
jgi:murein DD-endopeptidase MepM/ murein hydrolase activator NlpD